MLSNYNDKLETLYKSAEEKMPYFKRNYYEQAFMKYYEENLPIYEELNSELEGKDTDFVDNYISEFADLFVGIFKAEYDAIDKKGKKSTYVTNHNTPMVVFVFPAILNYSAKWCKPCVEKLVEKWNLAFTEYKIGYGTFENIKSGFKSKLCYITTAVCDSLNKEDDCRELNLLRDYRDNILAAETEGQELINEYYDIAPTIVKRINRSEGSDEVYSKLYDEFIVKCIKSIENYEYDKCREIYTEMVTELKKKYVY